MICGTKSVVPTYVSIVNNWNLYLFFSSGLEYVVTKGSEYDFWQEGVYNAHENIYRCFAYKAYSNDFIKMAQGTISILGK